MSPFKMAHECEARLGLTKFGPNAMTDSSSHPFRMEFEKFWLPVSWMLETAIVLELALGRWRRLYTRADPHNIQPEQFAIFVGFCRRTSRSSSKCSRKVVIPSACAATAPMTRQHCATNICIIHSQPIGPVVNRAVPFRPLSRFIWFRDACESFCHCAYPIRGISKRSVVRQ